MKIRDFQISTALATLFALFFVACAPVADAGEESLEQISNSAVKYCLGTMGLFLLSGKKVVPMTKLGNVLYVASLATGTVCATKGTSWAWQAMEKEYLEERQGETDIKILLDELGIDPKSELARAIRHDHKGGGSFERLRAHYQNDPRIATSKKDAKSAPAAQFPASTLPDQSKSGG